jgi:G3E family GTPase
MTPIVLLTGVDAEPMAAAMVGLQFDLPRAVAVRHHIDPERETLERVVSDVNGAIERVTIPLSHACIPCALREDIVPTLERLGRDGRWATIVAHLPIAVNARQVCNVLAWNAALSSVVRVGCVVTAIAGERTVDELLGDALLRERGCQSSLDDVRGIGEVACGMVEYADVVVATGSCGGMAADLLRNLARPDAHVAMGLEELDVRLADGLHDHRRTHAWVDPLRCDPLPPVLSDRVWRADLRTTRPFHPDRLLASLDALGGGRHRSRGCFHLPTRPGRALVWDGSGGQLSIGRGELWGDRHPMSRIVAIGVGAAPLDLGLVFESALLGDGEGADRRGAWSLATDGLEPWLGPIRDAA